MRAAALSLLLLVQEGEKPKVDFSKHTQAREYKFTATKILASPDGKYAWTDKGCIRTADWNVIDEAKNVNELVFSEDGKTTWAIGAVEQSGLALYTLPDWKSVVAAGVGGNFVACDLSKDRKTILGCGPFADAICLVSRWETASPARDVLKGDEMIFARFVDAKRFVTASKKGGLHLWEIGKPAPLVSKSVGEEAPACAISPDRKHLFVAGATAFKKFSLADLSEMAAGVEKMPPKPAVAVSPKGRLVALYGGGACEFFETGTMTRVSVPLGRDVAIGAVAFSSDETYAVLGDSTARKMYVVQLADNSVAREFDTLAPPTAVAIGPKGAWIVATTGTVTYAWAPPRKK